MKKLEHFVKILFKKKRNRCIMTLMICLFFIFNAIYKNAINANLKRMYYIDLVEAKKTYLLLEVETSIFTQLTNSENLESGMLHMRDGKVFPVRLDENNNTFVVDTEENTFLKGKIFSFNKSNLKMKTILEKNSYNLAYETEKEIVIENESDININKLSKDEKDNKKDSVFTKMNSN